MVLKSVLGTVSGQSQRDPETANIDRYTARDLLRNERREVIVELLRDRNEMRKCDVVDRVAEHEFARPISEIGQPERKRIYVSLRQCHLPKLRDAGVIEGGPDDDVIRPGPDIAGLYPHIDVDETPVLRREW